MPSVTTRPLMCNFHQKRVSMRMNRSNGVPRPRRMWTVLAISVGLLGLPATVTSAAATTASPTAHLEKYAANWKSSGDTSKPVIASVAHPDGQQDVFWKGTDGNIWEIKHSGGTWHGPSRIRVGPVDSAPAAVFQSSTRKEYVFWKGTDGNIWEAYSNGAWHGPIRIGMGPVSSAPTAVTWGNHVDVFWRGIDGNLWEGKNSGGTWSGPYRIGMGRLGSAPTAAAFTAGVQNVLWRGVDGNLWEGKYSGGAWHGPLKIGMGPMGSAPSATIQPSSNQEDVVWMGMGGNIWETVYNGSWIGPVKLGMGRLGSAPSATAWGSEVDLYWRGANGKLWKGWDSKGTWHGPVSQGLGYIPNN
jgi:hypothetical protein